MKFIRKVEALVGEPAEAWGGGGSKIASYRIARYLEGETKGLGKRGDSFWFLGDKAWSYGTAIAERAGKKLYVNMTDYSGTTKALQHELVSVARDQMHLDVHLLRNTSLPRGHREDLALPEGPAA
jgi:hypothetical protein